MNVLIACEYSGTVRDAFIKRGHWAMSCDLLPTEMPGPHYQGDVRDILNEKWDLIVAHPECTYITNSGVRWLDRDIDRWKKMWEACEFFRLFLNHSCPRIVIENPIPHKYALGWIGQKYTQLIQPWQFGHQASKATCLWLKGLPDLVPTDIVGPMPKGATLEERKAWQPIFYATPSEDRWKDRSRTFEGIADAMAEQWGAV